MTVTVTVTGHKELIRKLGGLGNAMRVVVRAVGELSHGGEAVLTRHIGNACRRMLNLRDETEQQLWVIQKERPDSPHKIDAAMAAILSWEARNDALTAGVGERRRSVYEDRGLETV